MAPETQVALIGVLGLVLGVSLTARWQSRNDLRLYIIDKKIELYSSFLEYLGDVLAIDISDWDFYRAPNRETKKPQTEEEAREQLAECKERLVVAEKSRELNTRLLRFKGRFDLLAGKRVRARFYSFPSITEHSTVEKRTRVYLDAYEKIRKEMIDEIAVLSKNRKTLLSN